MTSTRCLTWYFFTVAALTVTWWGWMVVDPGSRSLFFGSSDYRAYLASDLVAYVVAPVCAALGMRRRAAWTELVIALHLGGALYATLLVWSTFFISSSGTVGVIAMTLTLPVPIYALLRRR